MTLHLSIVGIDGSGKSTVARALPSILAAEYGVRAASAGDEFRVSDPAQDLLVPGFAPAGLPWSARLSRWLKPIARSVSAIRWLYPVVKLLQMLFLDRAARVLARRSGAAVAVCDGNTFLLSAGRIANYVAPASAGEQAAVDAQGISRLIRAIQGAPGRPSAGPARLIRWLNPVLRFLGLDFLWLPGIVVLLDVSPVVAMQRIALRGGRRDAHENLDDMAQARGMYRIALDALERLGTTRVIRIQADGLSLPQTLAAVVSALGATIRAQQSALQLMPASDPLGTSKVTSSPQGIVQRLLSYQYLVRYLIGHFADHAWREIMFLLSRSGQRFLREGYSANVMNLIYDQDRRRYGWLDRIFMDYPLHRAVYDRLHVLVPRLTADIERRMASQKRVRIFTAPSGYAEDLFRALAAIRANDPAAMSRIDLVAADLDQNQEIGDALKERARQLGLQLTFLRCDITVPSAQRALAALGPFDIGVFVGLSAWIPKPMLMRHLTWLRAQLRRDGVLVSDCFTPAAYALSGFCMGYQANYYTPEIYANLVGRCGFFGDRDQAISGRDRINHVLTFRPLLVFPPATDPCALDHAA